VGFSQNIQDTIQDISPEFMDGSNPGLRADPRTSAEFADLRADNLGALNRAVASA
jgi:hypothetical protein